MNLQLFCLPYAGGSRSFFSGLKQELEPDISVYPIEYSGHGERIKEPLFHEWEPFLKDVSEQIQSLYDPANQIALCGYSMGSLVAHELTAQNMLPRMPVHLFLISHSAPNVNWLGSGQFLETDEKMLEKIQSLGGFKGIDEKILHSRYFQYMHMAPLKADYHLLTCYEHPAAKFTDINATVFFASGDKSISQIEKWQKYYRIVKFCEMEGTHFLLKTQYKNIARIMAENIDRPYL